MTDGENGPGRRVGDAAAVGGDRKVPLERRVGSQQDADVGATFSVHRGAGT